ncbi:MAG TPA: potassium channel family protein [Thermohalobaculum sp.]|nr:potassium channel family protein [Thermohalobaculum sp.]
MLVQLTLGAVLVVVSAVLHIVALDLINHKVRAVTLMHAVPLRARVRIPLLVFATLGTFLSHVAQIWVWAGVYLALGEFDRLEPALYFSTVVFTTLGFGDIVVSPDWRLMASCEAAAGLLLFGLSTAFLFEVLREILRRRRD